MKDPVHKTKAMTVFLFCILITYDCCTRFKGIKKTDNVLRRIVVFKPKTTFNRRLMLNRSS